MTSITLHDAEQRYGISHLDHLDRDADLPVVDTIGFQGDVAIIANATLQATTPIPRRGYPVVRGENGANTHALYGQGFYDAEAASDGLVLGVVTVPDGGTALLSHPEHGGLLLAPGSYQLRRQREQADEIRMVAD